MVTITGPNNQPVAEREGKKLDFSQHISAANYGDPLRVTVSYKTPPGNALKKVRYNLELDYRPDALIPYPDWLARLSISSLAVLWAVVCLVIMALLWTGKPQAYWSRRHPFTGVLNRLRRKT